jgi:hypothetical protein
MSREFLTRFIRENAPGYRNISLEGYTYRELLAIKEQVSRKIPAHKCEVCNGSGAVLYIECCSCKGSGYR